MINTIDETNLGGLRSPVDERDYKLGSIQAPVVLPTEYLPDNTALPVYNQGAQPSCGGHAGTKLQNILLGLSSTLSPRFVYALCKKIDGFPTEQGTTGRAIMQVLQKYGVCSNDLFPNDTTLPYAEYSDWTKIPQAAYVDALSRRIGPYAQVSDLSFQGLKQAVYQNKSVVVLKSPWIPSSWTSISSGTGHFFPLDGYELDKIRFANSFGSAWGTGCNGGGNGWGYLLESDIPTIVEAWTAVEPATLIPPAPLPPNPSVQQELSWLAQVKQFCLKVAAYLQGK